MIRNGVSKLAQESKRLSSQIIKSYQYNEIWPKAFFASHSSLNSTRVNSFAGIRRFSTGSSTLKMRFVQFESIKGGPQRLGVQLTENGDIIDVSGVDSAIPNALVQFLKAGPSVLEKAKRIVAEGKSVLQPSQVKLLPPVTLPDKVICVGLNYKGHCDEQNISYPEEPMLFSKWGSCVIGPSADIRYPSFTEKLDWEVEMAVVMGKTASGVSESEAMDHVFGFTVAQDISARDWQKKSRNGGQWLIAKSANDSCPLGPAVVTKETVADPYTLYIRSKVNGVLKQDSNTNELIHRVDKIVSHASRFFTLLPGDVILTGTPAGVGMFRKPPEFLKRGDVIESEIQFIGKLKNTVV